MPGIVGLISQMPREAAEGQLRHMLEAMSRESFYVTGRWSDEALGVYVGWVARKGSFCDGMPLQNERGDAVLVFSGEEFSDPGTEETLRHRGHRQDGSGPSYLIHLYEDEPGFLSGLNGRFHGLLADRARATTTLFNDRYGMHRLYFHESRDAFYFAAEAKAILAVRPELRRLHPRSLGEFVSCGAVMEGRTLFQGIELLPSASAWTFRNGTLARKESYFKPAEWEGQEPLDKDAFYDTLRDAYMRNLPRYFEGRERIAMSLTGGLDTRMIMAGRRPAAGSLPCYTFGSMFRDCQDVVLSRRLAEICGQSHQVIRAGEEFLSKFAHYAERAIYLSDGCVDVSRSPDVYINEKAREIAPVRMTGNYGGEVLRRVRTFKPEEQLPGLFAPEFLADVHRTNETYREALCAHPISFTVFKQLPWNHYGILALEESRLSLRSPFLDNDFVKALYRAPIESLSGDDVSLRLIADGNKDLLKIPTDRGLIGERGRLSRAMSRALLEFLFKAEYAYDMGMPQGVAQVDHALSALHLERLFLGRHKVFHFRLWYRDYLGGYLRETLLDPRSLSRPYLERKGLERVVQGHLKGDRNYTNQIHKVLALELLHRVFIDSAVPNQTAKRRELPVVVSMN